MQRNVVVTGIGVVSPIGIGKEQYWRALCEGLTRYRKISLFDSAAFSVHSAGEIIEFDPVALLGKKGLRTLDRSTKLIMSAAQLAIDDAKLQISEQNTYITGVSIGTTFGSLHSISQFDRDGLIEGPKYVNPSHFPNTVINSPASQVSIRFQIKGFNTTISTGFCAGIDAVTYASDFIRLNRADVVLAGAVEEICEETFFGFHKLGYLSGMDGSEPICCPFDARRNGIILSEGAAVLILEDEQHALRRGAAIVAKVLGYGNAFDPDADKNFNSSGTGLINAIVLALKDASIAPEAVDCIFSGANSTRGLDRMETEVIKAVFGKDAYTIPVSAVKSMIGESYSASSALVISAAVSAIQQDVIPPTVNYWERDPACDLDYVPNYSRQKKLNTILVLSADPYGNSSAIVLRKYH